MNRRDVFRPGRPFRCPNGHGLGLVMRNGSGHQQLLLYREAVDLGSETDVDVMAVAEGVILDVRCSICDQVRTWVPGDATLRRLIEKMQERE